MSDEKIATPDATEQAPAAAAEKPATDATVTAEEKKPPEGYVPHGALHQERMTRRRLERDLAEERMWKEQAQKRLDELTQRFAKAAEPKPPDPDTDPVGGIVHETRQTREEVAALRKERDEERKTAEAERQQAAFNQAFQREAQMFAARQPDFVQAQAHLFDDVIAEAEEAGASRREAEQEAWRRWHSVVNRAFQDGANPAERIYGLAKRRGYKAATPDKTIETINKGQAAASPLAAASGKASGGLTAETIAKMSQEEFDKLSEADFRRAMGG